MIDQYIDRGRERDTDAHTHRERETERDRERERETERDRERQRETEREISTLGRKNHTRRGFHQPGDSKHAGAARASSCQWGDG